MAGSPKTFNRTTVSALSNEYLDYLLFVISVKEPITKKIEEILSDDQEIERKWLIQKE